MHRKFYVSLAAAVAALITFTTPSFAQKYPDRPIRVIIPLPPGGSVDIVARLLQPLLEKSLGQSLVIDNRSGASGIIGANAVATASPDGYTLLLAPTTFSITAALHPKLPFDPLRAFQPVTVVGRSAQLVLANPKVAATSLQEFVALAKANPNTLNYSTPGASSQAHLLFELWSQQAGIKMQHKALGQLAITHRLASITARREYAEAGCLMAYGAPIRDNYRQAADYVAKILRGAVPAELPVGQPTEFDFVINLKTAEALGLALPQALRARAEKI